MMVKGQGEGHVITINGTIGKVLSKGTHLPNMKPLSLKVKKLSAIQKCDRRTDDKVILKWCFASMAPQKSL